MSTCWPWFHAPYSALAAEAWTKTIVSSGCGAAGANGNVPCQPEVMRAQSETWLAQNAPQVLAQIGGSLPLATYTLARYLHSEVGSGTVEERVAVAESAVNRARRERLPQGILGLLLYRQPIGHPNRGYYGPIHGIGTGTSTAPYGRWAATSRDPSTMSVLLAHLVASGASGDFAQGADDQDGPEAWISKGQTALHNYVRGLASKGKFWVGPLPGVDHWHTFLQFTPGPIERATNGKAWLQRGLDALTLPRQRAEWSGITSTCRKPSSVEMAMTRSPRATSFLIASAGLALGGLLAHFVARRYVHAP